MPKETRTYKDRAKYLVMAVTKKRHRLKELAIQAKGGKCQVCGYSKYVGALDFHHIDPTHKSFKLYMEELYRSWDLIIKEIDKCFLVCANCHREIHGGVLDTLKIRT